MLKKVSQRFFLSKETLLLILISFFLIGLRFLWIDRFPVGINHDEAEVVLSAKTYWNYGADISNTSFPKSIFTNGTAGSLSGLPSFLLAPAIGWSNLSLTVARIPFVLLNIASLGILALIVWQFTKNKVFVWATIFVGLINPWFFAYSRATTEAPFSLFFVLLGIYLLFKNKGKRILYSLVPFILAFYSYFGAKPVIPILIPVLIFLHGRFIGKTDKKIYLAYILTFIFFIGIYFYSLIGLSGNSTLSYRSGRELVFMNLGRFSTQIDEQRRATIGHPAINIMYNKGTSLVKEMFSKYIGWISPDHLFLGGDTPSIYRFGEHGVYYYFDIIFIILGIYALAKLKISSNRKLFISLLVALFLISPIPSAVSKIGDSYFFRGFLLVPAMVVLIAGGAAFLCKNLNGKLRTVILGITTASYLALYINFLIFFFFRYPIKQQENHFLSGRVVSNYLKRARDISDQRLVVITTSPYAMYHQYLFYFNGLENTKPQVKSEEHIINNIYFRDECDDFEDQDIVIFDSRLNCDLSNEDNSLIIQDQKDAGFQFSILNDSLCKDVELAPWRREHYISDYDLEDMSVEQFCNRWIYEYKE